MTPNERDRAALTAFWNAYGEKFRFEMSRTGEANIDACTLVAIKVAAAVLSAPVCEGGPRVIEAAGVGVRVKPPEPIANDATKYSAQWLANEITRNNYKALGHHNCGFCGYMTAYEFEVYGVYFDPGCDCTRGERRASSCKEIAEWLAMQSSDEIRDSILQGWRK